MKYEDGLKFFFFFTDSNLVLNNFFNYHKAATQDIIMQKQTNKQNHRNIAQNACPLHRCKISIEQMLVQAECVSCLLSALY